MLMRCGRLGGYLMVLVMGGGSGFAFLVLPCRYRAALACFAVGGNGSKSKYSFWDVLEVRLSCNDWMT